MNWTVFFTALVSGAVAIVVLLVLLFTTRRVMVKQVVGVITFHEYNAATIAEILHEAVKFCPDVHYFSRPSKDDGWYKLFVVDSPDAEKFFKSVSAQLSARSVPRSD